jgi:hypothetical protein
MRAEEKIDIDVFKVVTRAIAHSNSLEAMTTYLSQLLVAALGVKGCSIFAHNPASGELEIIGTSGLRASFLNKGPVLSKKSIARTLKGAPVVVSDVETSKALQYPRPHPGRRHSCNRVAAGDFLWASDRRNAALPS